MRQWHASPECCGMYADSASSTVRLLPLIPGHQGSHSQNRRLFRKKIAGHELLFDSNIESRRRLANIVNMVCRNLRPPNRPSPASLAGMIANLARRQGGSAPGQGLVSAETQNSPKSRHLFPSQMWGPTILVSCTPAGRDRRWWGNEGNDQSLTSSLSL
jgi:hypothetical protein